MDHIIVVIFVIAYPVWSGYRFRQVKHRSKRREVAYMESAAGQWGLVALVLLYMLIVGRDMAEIGLSMHLDWKMAIALMATGAIVVFFCYQGWLLTKSTEAQHKVRQQVRRISPIIPRNFRQLAGFILLAITAGICEEILFRGFLINYLNMYTNIYSAALVSSIVFGIAHAYQGPRGILQGMIAGIVFAGLYLFSGSLLAPIVLHAIVDIHGGWAGYYVISRERGTFSDAS